MGIGFYFSEIGWASAFISLKFTNVGHTKTKTLNLLRFLLILITISEFRLSPNKCSCFIFCWWLNTFCSAPFEADINIQIVVSVNVVAISN